MAAPRFSPEADPLTRALDKIRHLGEDAQLTLPEAADLLEVSHSTFERLAIPWVQWSARQRRWRYGSILARARELELVTLRSLGGG